MKKISIIVPVYNTAKFLAPCIESILNQSYPSFELILVDDGSNDDSGNICIYYAGKDSRVHVIQQKNKGVAAARNTGLNAANGTYISFVDSDDWIEPDMYENMMRIINQYDCDVVMCDCVKDYDERHVVYTHDIRPGYYNIDQLKREYYPHLLMMENVEYPATISNWLILYRARESEGLTSLGLIRYVEGVRYSEDLLFGSEVMLNAKSFYYMKGSYYYHYRMNSESVSHKFVSDKWDDYLRLYRATQERIRTEAYDFRLQIDKMLLFFLYNAAGDVIETNLLSTGEKLQKVRDMLNTSETRRMFHRISVSRLPIPWKQKFLTGLFKYKGIYFLIVLRSLTHENKRNDTGNA